MNGTTTYVELEAVNGTTTHHELWLDLSNRPHRTGNTITPTPHDVITPVELWDDTPTDPEPTYGSELAEAERPPPPPHAIMGPSTTTYPRNVGWHTEDQTPFGTNDAPRKLSDLTIHNITKLHTQEITADQEPNCIAAWKSRLGPHIPFPKVFASFGTPLSDDTEERQWRKLVQRATFVRNRDTSLPSDKCRLCGTQVERMLHLLQCQ